MRRMLWRNLSLLLPSIVFLIYIFIATGTQLGLLAIDFETAHRDLVYQPPSREFLMGTDFLGRSVLQRTLQATRVAMVVGTLSTLLAVFLGVLLGSMAGYLRGWVDYLIVWIYTTLDSIPYILLLAAFAFALGQGLSNVFLALGLTTWTTLCKIIRTEVIKLRTTEYVLAAKAQGFRTWQILFQQILPNLSHLIFIQAGIIFVSVIKIEVILSYLGLGMEPGSPSWGLMIDDAKQEITRGIWWNMAAATLFMFGLILSVHLLLEALRKRWDPQNNEIPSQG
jgi:ABC-type dipeptide/oligopeptide/nickel transport system permease subunit